MAMRLYGAMYFVPDSLDDGMSYKTFLSAWAEYAIFIV